MSNFIVWLGVVSGCFRVMDHYEENNKNNYYLRTDDRRTHIAITTITPLPKPYACMHISVECQRVNTNKGIEDFCNARKEKK